MAKKMSGGKEPGMRKIGTRPGKPAQFMTNPSGHKGEMSFGGSRKAKGHKGK